jgi:hypothetical protein
MMSSKHHDSIVDKNRERWDPCGSIAEKNRRHLALGEQAKEIPPKETYVYVELANGLTAHDIMGLLAMNDTADHPTVRGLVDACDPCGAGIVFVPNSNNTLKVWTVYANAKDEISGRYKLAKRLKQVPGVSQVMFPTPTPA